MGRCETATVFVCGVLTVKSVFEQLGSEKAYEYLTANHPYITVVDGNSWHNERFSELMYDTKTAESLEEALKAPKQRSYDRGGKWGDVGCSETDILWNLSICLERQSFGSTERWGYSRCGTNAATFPLPDIESLRKGVDETMRANGFVEFSINVLVEQHAG